MHTPEVRNVVVRLWGEETRRFYSDVVVEVPGSVPYERIESMALRSFDGVPDLGWNFCGTTGIWPGNCGRRLQPEVLRAADDSDVAQLKLLRSPRGTVVVACFGPKVESTPARKRAGSKS